MAYNETPIVKPIPRSNYPNNGGTPIWRTPVGAIMHHIVGTLPGCTAHFQNPDTGYATNFGIGSTDGRGGGDWEIHQYVPANAVAWGNGNTDLNARGVSIEHENDLRIGIAGKPRPEVHELSARFLAKLARQYNWRIGGRLQLVARDFPNHDFYGESVPGFGTEFNVITHRSVALKDCPKDLDFGWVVRRANEILSGVSPIIESEEDIMPAFHRKASNGDIRYQREPGTPLVPVSGEEWNGFAANGAKYHNHTDAAWNALVNRVGTAAKPEPTGGIANVTVPPIEGLTVTIDYAALAKAIWDEQASRISE